MSVSDSFLRCDIEGSLAQLFKAAGRYEIVNVTTREPSLEEAFLAYYGVGEDGDRMSHQQVLQGRPAMATVRSGMLSSLFLKTLRDQRRSMAWWSLGAGILVGVMVGFYPTIEGIEGLQELVDQYPDSLMAMFGASDLAGFSTPAGYLNAELFGFMLPMLIAVFAVGRGSGAVAGEERAGTMELLLSQPVSRSRLVLEKFGAMTVSVLELSTFIWVVLVVGAKLVGMDIGVYTARGDVFQPGVAGAGLWRSGLRRRRRDGTARPQRGDRRLRSGRRLGVEYTEPVVAVHGAGQVALADALLQRRHAAGERPQSGARGHNAGRWRWPAWVRRMWAFSAGTYACSAGKWTETAESPASGSTGGRH